MSSLKAKVIRVLIQLGRVRGLRPLVHFFFTHMNNFLPLERLLENEDWVAFHHPQPGYPLHILILPRRRIDALIDVPENCSELFASLFPLVQRLIKAYQLDQYGYRLITNGGPHQSIPQWHWHLISEYPGETHA